MLAGSLVAFLSSAAAFANAASDDALLSNLDESNDAGIAVGTPVDSPYVDFTQAIRFQTGSNERGYNLTSVKAVLANASDSDGVRVRIFGARSNGTPYISFYTLTNPVIADGTLTFTAPESATLRKNAGYFVVFDSTASGAGNDYEIRGTESEFLNSQAVGWTLSEDRHARNNDSASWTTDSAVPLIEINGDAVVQATDANLNALRMWDGNGKLVTYSPFFDSSITSYATKASPKVDRITVLGTASNDGGATVDYLDEDDQLLTDADPDTEGFQVDLEAGANTINVRVTAEDGSTTRTYTMVVTRRASRVSADALASNLDEDFSKRLFVGNLEPGKILRVQALGFETGGNDAGYVLTSVKILIWELSSWAGVRVRIFSSTAEGNPDSSLYALSGTIVLPTTDQGPEESARISTFDAPANATLEPNTRYFVVLDSKFSQLYRYYKVWGTKSDDISKVADGWSMNNFRHTGIRDSGVWTTADEVPFVDVSGYAVVPSSDATLSALGLTWDDGGTATDIALNPTFDASKTSYTASVANGVDQVTIAGTKSDIGARVDYFDGADSALTDADGNAAGFQVDLAAGANTIKAKVAASDGETTQTYTVVVTRGAGDTTPPPALGAWFQNVPDEHDGSSVFNLELAFSEAVFDGTESFDKNQAIQDALQLTGGTFRGRRRAVQGSYDRWILRIEPSGDDDVTVRLPATTGSCGTAGAICTPDNRPLSAPASATIEGPAAEVPDAPSAPTLTAGETWLDVSWTAPDDNGAAITGYDVHYRETGGNWQDANHTGTSTTKRITGLTADTAYEVRVRASNSEGAGDWSPSASARTDAAAEAPDAPSAPTLTAGETWIEASWTAPADNGAAITGYDVHYRETGGNWQNANHTGTGTTKRIESLTPDTAYEVRVRASNAEGTGDWSPSASSRTDAADGTADGDVRLVNGSTEMEGRVEIFHDGEWGTVCDDRFVSEDAEVVCRQLGYTGGEVHTRAAFGAGSGTIWMDDVRCAGTESRLADCAFRGWGRNNCRHSEDVGVSCGPAASMSLESAMASGVELTLRFDRALNGGSAPAPGDFVVAAGSSRGAAAFSPDAATFSTDAAAVPVESVAVEGGAAVLTLSRTVEPHERVSVSYLPAPMHPLQDTSYNPAPALIGHAVRHVPAMESREAAPTELPAKSMPAPNFAGEEKIEVLHLPSRGLVDVWPLTAMADLEVLGLGDNAVSDVTALGSLENLRVLDLSGNAVTDLWPLAAVADLEVLNLGDNAVGDITALGSLEHLRVLDLSGNAVTDLWPITGLTALRRLDLSGNRVADLQPLSELRHLEVLVLDGNEVSDLSPLWGLPKLAHLDLGHNRVSDAAPLQEARSLQRLDLAGNRLRDIRVLGDLEKLVWLRVSGNPIADFSPLERLPAVRWIVLDDQAPGGR